MIDLKDLIFVEKYRPKNIDSVISIHTNKIKKYIQTKAIPHFLFTSKSPGTGKTSTALAIIKELDCDKLIINSSSDRKIEMIREKVNMFSQLQSSKPGIKRCIFLDEVDGMLKNSQNALRNIMETHSTNCFFILTANNIEKVIEPIQSRCVALELSSPPKDLIIVRVVNICNSEGIKYDSNSIKKLVDRLYPDIRSIVQFIQTTKIENKSLEDATNDYIDKYEKCLKLILNKKFIEIKEMVFTGEIDVRSFNGWLFKNIFKYSKKIGLREVKDIIQVLADNELAFAYGASEQIIFLAGLLKVISIIRG